MSENQVWEFVAAWQRKDIETLMKYIAQDCVYITTTGPGPGTVYTGENEVRQGFMAILADTNPDDDHFGPLYLWDNKGLLEWSSRSVDANNQSIIVRGCDLLEFEGEKIRRKDAFRKVNA